MLGVSFDARQNLLRSARRYKEILERFKHGEEALNYHHFIALRREENSVDVRWYKMDTTSNVLDFVPFMGRFSFQDAVVVITGAGSGMGREISRVAASKGAKCVLTDISEAGLEQTVSLIGQENTGVEILTHVCDVSSREAVFRLKESVERKYGPEIHALFNNAGIICAETFDGTTFEEYDQVLAINQGGVFNCLKIFLPMLKAAAPRTCAVVNTSSIAGLIGYPGNAAYGTSKWAVRGMTEGFRSECKLMPALSHIQVTVVHPGAVKTPIFLNNSKMIHDTKLGGNIDDKYKLTTSDQMHKLLSSGGSTTPRSAAIQITNGVLNGRERVFVGTDAVIVEALSRISPWFVHTKLGLVTSLAGSFLWARFIGKKAALFTILLVIYRFYNKVPS